MLCRHLTRASCCVKSGTIYLFYNMLHAKFLMHFNYLHLNWYPDNVFNLYAEYCIEYGTCPLTSNEHKVPVFNTDVYFNLMLCKKVFLEAVVSDLGQFQCYLISTRGERDFDGVRYSSKESVIVFF